MRSNEFIIEHLDLEEIYDIGLWQLEEVTRQLKNDQRNVYESLDDVSKVNKLLAQYKVDPCIGQHYFPISIISIPLGKIMNIARSESIGKLTNITDRNLFFDFGKGERPFPYNLESGDMLHTTLLFASLEEQEKFRSWLHLSFDNSWRITEKTI